jgi:hypothetical protein
MKMKDARQKNQCPGGLLYGMVRNQLNDITEPGGTI